MWRNSKSAAESDYKINIPEYEDDEILEILKKRNYYQSEAVELALEEARNRDLIHSEQDLLSEEFRTEKLQFGLFPKIEEDRNKSKIRKSIARGILISGVLPTVWGFLQINSGNNVEGTLFIAGGVLWILFSARLIQQFNLKLIYGLFLLSIISLFVVAKFLLIRNSIVIMDFFIAALVHGLLFYGLFFLKKLR